MIGNILIVVTGITDNLIDVKTPTFSPTCSFIMVV